MKSGGQGQSPKNANVKVRKVDKSNIPIEMVDSEEGNYNQILPKVKVKKKKRSKSPELSDRGSIAMSSSKLGLRGQGSRLKMRDTLSQSIHFVPTNIEVPKK